MIKFTIQKIFHRLFGWHYTREGQRIDKTYWRLAWPDQVGDTCYYCNKMIYREAVEG